MQLNYFKLMQEWLNKRFSAKNVARHKGFTLLELLVATALMGLAVSLTINMLSQFNKVNNSSFAKTTLEEELRNTLNRLEKETLSASVVIAAHPDDGTVTTTKNRLVLSVPLYNEQGFITYGNDGKPLTDTIVLSKEVDANGAILGNRANPAKEEKLMFRITPADDSTRETVDSQAIAKHLMPTDGSGNYTYPTGVSASSEGVFRFYTTAGTEVDPSDTSNLNEVAMVKVTLWAEKMYGAGSITAKKVTDIRLRNWADPSTPTPTPSATPSTVPSGGATPTPGPTATATATAACLAAGAVCTHPGTCDTCCSGTNTNNMGTRTCDP